MVNWAEFTSIERAYFVTATERRAIDWAISVIETQRAANKSAIFVIWTECRALRTAIQPYFFSAKCGNIEHAFGISK
jgi:hypothetical protein